jgi:hypothetical protein
MRQHGDIADANPSIQACLQMPICSPSMPQHAPTCPNSLSTSPQITRPSTSPIRRASSASDQLPDGGVAVALRRMQLRSRHLIRMQMRPSVLQHVDMVDQPRRCRQVEGRMPAAVTKVDGCALSEKVAQDLNVRSARREVLCKRPVSAYLHARTPSCIIGETLIRSLSSVGVPKIRASMVLPPSLGCWTVFGRVSTCADGLSSLSVHLYQR